MTAKGVGQRVRLSPDKRRAQIVRVALDAFRESGFAQTSIRDLADALDMSIAGMYHYFPSKDDLLFTILTEGLDRLLCEMESARERASSPEERLRSMLTVWIEIIVQDRALVRVLVDNADKLEPERRATLRAKMREGADMVTGEIRQIAAEGRLKDLNPNVMSYSLHGMANWVNYWYDPDGEVDIHSLANQITDIFLHGVLK